jgi:nitrogen fixation/metabolism regulation signal transduction histidine kinase
VLDECVSSILSQVKLLRQISAEFSSFASSPTPRPEPTALPALIEEVVEPYRDRPRAPHRDRLCRRRRICRTVTIDRTLFARALTNVIENALHADAGHRAGCTISRNPQPQSGEVAAVVVEVTDTGVGMDQEALNKIFEPYFSTKATGTGLGLTIAKREHRAQRRHDRSHEPARYWHDRDDDLPWCNDVQRRTRGTPRDI